MNVNTLISAVKKLELRSQVRKLIPKENRQLELFSCEAWDRLLYTPSKELFGVSKTVGKRKLPRFMYHVTTEKAYQSMLKDGKIIPHQTIDAPSGTFLFDIKNFCKFWRKNDKVVEQPRTTLLNFITQSSDGKIVLLKIPTTEIDARSLRVRVQERCRQGSSNGLISLQSSKTPFTDTLEGIRYIMQGESIANLSRHNQLKKAVEYITPNEIDMKNVKLVGRTQVNPEEIDKAANAMEDAPDVWLALTKGMPEQKNFEHMI